MCPSMREKYFRYGNLLNTVPVCGMCYVWRSILKGLDVQREGIIWRVGDGTKIKVWEDPWSPRVLLGVHAHIKEVRQ